VHWSDDSLCPAKNPNGCGGGRRRGRRVLSFLELINALPSAGHERDRTSERARETEGEKEADREIGPRRPAERAGQIKTRRERKE